MGILSDGDIVARRAAGSLAIEPFDEKCLTPNGYDLRVAEVMLPDVSSHIYRGDVLALTAAAGPDESTTLVHREGKVLVPPQSRFLVSTLERVKMPDDVTAQLWIRSSFARRGVLGAFGKIEAGFEGTLTVGGFNAARAPLDLPIGERFCQVVFERMESVPRKLYAQRSGSYQGQSGITLAKEPK